MRAAGKRKAVVRHGRPGKILIRMDYLLFMQLHWPGEPVCSLQPCCTCTPGCEVVTWQPRFNDRSSLKRSGTFVASNYVGVDA